MRRENERVKQSPGAEDISRRNDLLRVAHLRRSAILERRRREDILLAGVDTAGEDEDAMAIAAGELLVGSMLADRQYADRLDRNDKVVLLDMPAGDQDQVALTPVAKAA